MRKPCSQWKVYFFVIGSKVKHERATENIPNKMSSSMIENCTYHSITIPPANAASIRTNGYFDSAILAFSGINKLNEQNAKMQAPA